MKKYFIIALFFLTAPIALAQPAPSTPTTQPTSQTQINSGFTALAPIPGLTDDTTTSLVNSATLATFFNNLYTYLIGVAAILAMFTIMWAGGSIAVNQDNVASIIDKKGRIAQAIWGLVLVLAPALVFSVINPSILNLSVNLPALDTKNTPYMGSVNGIASTTADTASGCTIVGASNILQIATCPSNSAVQKETNQCGSAGGQASTIFQNTRTDGTITSSTLMCAWPNKYVFIDTSDSGIFGFITSSFNTINNVQPLAISSNNPNNADSAIQFANICANSGLSTCISDPSFASADDCVPTPKTPLPGPARKCGELTLTCRDYNTAHTVIASLCSRSPNWNPFQ